jgi:hypothetical protein
MGRKMIDTYNLNLQSVLGFDTTTDDAQQAVRFM